MGINFKVSMVLEAINRMGPGVRKAMDTVDRLKGKATATARDTSKLNPVAGWSDKIAQVSRRMDEFGRKAASVRKDAEKLMASGLKDLAAGGSIAAPMFATVKPAADLQTTFTTMQVMGLSDKGRDIVRNQSMDLAKNLAFDLSQVVGVAWSLQKAGMNEAKMIQAQRVATNYAQLEYNRYGSDPNQTATHLAHIAESSGVLYASKQEREANGLRTQTDVDSYIVGKFERMAETLNKVVAVTSSDTATLAESIKYSMPTAKSLGWSEASAMLMSGIYSRFGIEGSMSGTHLKDFAARLNPYQHYIGEDVEKKSNRLTAMQEAGWLEGAQWSVTKSGQKKFSSAGQSVFHNQDGTLKGPEEIFSRIYEAYERFNSQGKRLQFEGILHDVLGEQGKDIAQLLNQNPEMFQHIQQDMGKVLSMEKSLEKYQSNVNTQWDIFKGNIATAGTLMGDLLLDDVAETLKGWNETLFGKGDERSPVAQWIEDHKELIAWIMKTVLFFATLTAGIGVLKIAAAGIKYAFVAPLMTAIGWLDKFGIRMTGLYDGFRYFRRLGGGVFESLWKGAQFAFPWLGKLMRFAGRIGGAYRGAVSGFKYFRAAGCGMFDSMLKGAQLVWPWLGKVMGWVRTFTPFWLRNAARIAAGWLIAMGPVGWIIAGITAMIAGAVWAWKSNFLGFRDTCGEIWDWINDYMDFILPGLSGKIGNFITDATASWEKLKTNVGERLDKISKFTSETMEGMRAIVHRVCNDMGVDFDGLTEKVKGFLEKMWEAQPGVQMYKGIKEHFDSFDSFRAQKHAADGFRKLRGEETSFIDPQNTEAVPISYLQTNAPQPPAPRAVPVTFVSNRRMEMPRLKPIPVQFAMEEPQNRSSNGIYRQQPYVVQPSFHKQSQEFRQTNNIKLESRQEAAEFVKQAVPDKYRNSNNNPRNQVGIPYGEVGELV